MYQKVYTAALPLLFLANSAEAHTHHRAHQGHHAHHSTHHVRHARHSRHARFSNYSQQDYYYSQDDTQRGFASFYHESFNGHRTASGQAYNRKQLTAAHKTLPLGSQVRVTDTNTGRSIVVKVNDRGPFTKNRIIDLSHEAASELGMLSHGVARVALQVLNLPGT